MNSRIKNADDSFNSNVFKVPSENIRDTLTSNDQNRVSQRVNNMNVKPTHSRIVKKGNNQPPAGHKYDNKVYDIEMN